MGGNEVIDHGLIDRLNVFLRTENAQAQTAPLECSGVQVVHKHLPIWVKEFSAHQINYAPLQRLSTVADTNSKNGQ